MSVRPTSQAIVDIPNIGFCPSSGLEEMHKGPCSQSTRSIKQLVSVNAPLNSAGQNSPKTHLKERVPCNNAKEALKSLASGFDDLIGEAVGKDLARERRNVHSSRLALENIAEGLKV